jgi:hypothetical protein
MRLRLLVSSVAAATLVAMPITAQAADRSAAPVKGEKLAGASWIIPLIVLLVVIGGVLLLADDNNPHSP